MGFLEEVLGHHTQLGEDHAQHQPQDGVVDVGQLTQPYREQAADYCQQNAHIAGIKAVKFLGQCYPLGRCLCLAVPILGFARGGHKLVQGAAGFGLPVFADQALGIAETGAGGKGRTHELLHGEGNGSQRGGQRIASLGGSLRHDLRCGQSAVDYRDGAEGHLLADDRDGQ